jgi:hypothetical protein
MPDDTWSLLSGAQPSPHRSLDDLIATTQCLLRRFYDLGPSDLHRLAKQLDRIADRLDSLADGAERGEAGEP